MSRFLQASALLVLALSLFFSLAFAQSNGQALFNANCARCHGTDGAGKTAVAARLNIPNLGSAAVQSLTNAEIYDSIARGTRHKEYPHGYEFRGMTKADINALVEHIRSFAKK